MDKFLAFQPGTTMTVALLREIASDDDLAEAFVEQSVRGSVLVGRLLSIIKKCGEQDRADRILKEFMGMESAQIRWDEVGEDGYIGGRGMH